MTGIKESKVSSGSCGVSTATMLSGVFFGELKNKSSMDEVLLSSVLWIFGENKNESVPSIGLTLLCHDSEGLEGSGPFGCGMPGGLKPPPFGGGLSVIGGFGVSTGRGGGETDACELWSSGGCEGWLVMAVNKRIAAGRKSKSTTSTTVIRILPRSVNS